MQRRQLPLTQARANFSQISRKGGIRPGEIVEVTRRGRVVLILQRPEDFAYRLARQSKAGEAGELWGTATILGDLDEASRVAEARVKASLRRRGRRL